MGTSKIEETKRIYLKDVIRVFLHLFLLLFMTCFLWMQTVVKGENGIFNRVRSQRLSKVGS